jgi:phosphatidylserine/phosphatidylglycerophosphate/cardiolipin synthase-like enzyme
MTSSESRDVLPGGDALIARVRTEMSTPALGRVRLALGYLFVPGLEPIWDALERSAATEIQFLIGNTAGVLTDEQRIAAASTSGILSSHSRVEPELDMAATARADRDRIVSETAEALRENLRHLPRSPQNDGFLLRLAQAIGANRLRVRIYPDGRLHAKASLFEGRKNEGSTAIVGSSNLTLPSAGNPTEMNVVLTDAGDFASVTGWFDALWAASQDFTRALFLEVSARSSEN